MQGISPFLFAFRLTAFNYASHPTLSVPPRRVCLDLLQRGCSSHRSLGNLRLSTSSSTPRTVRFCCSAYAPTYPDCPGPLALWRGDFPQGLTLSAVLLLPPQRLRASALGIKPTVGLIGFTQASSLRHLLAVLGLILLQSLFRFVFFARLFSLC